MNSTDFLDQQVSAEQYQERYSGLRLANTHREEANESERPVSCVT